MEKVLKLAFIETISRQKTLDPPAAFYAPYGVWISLQPNWFSKMPQKHN